MRVTFVIKSVSVQGGGAERVFADVANGLVHHGHHVVVVSFDEPGAPTFYPLNDGVQRRDLQIGVPGLPSPRLKLLAGLLRMRRAIMDSRPDVVVGFMHSTYVPMALSMFGSGVPMVASEHVGARHFFNRPLQRLLVNALNGCFVAKTVPTLRQRQECPKHLQGKVHVLPNPLDLHQFSADRQKSPENPPILLCVGRFMEEKDHGSLLSAFAEVEGEFPGWILRLVGDGILRPRLKAQVDRLGLQAKVEMPGVINDVVDEYLRASIVVVPSIYESFGLTVVEALACGRPVIGFADCLEPLDIAVNGKNALLVDGAGDRVSSLARGLRTLMADAEMRFRLGDAGPSSVIRFERNAVVSRWVAFLRECASSA